MFKRILYLLKYYLFWLLFFIVLKLVFLFYYHAKSFELIDLWGDIFLHGLRLDLSVSAYLTLAPVFGSFVLFFMPPLAYHRLIKVYTYIIVVFFSLLAAADLSLYREWGFRMDATPLLYITKPKEAFASVSFLFVVKHLLIAAVLSFVFIYIFETFFSRKSFEPKFSRASFSTLLLFFIFLFLPMRGSLQISSITLSSAYFSENNFANHAAINLPWNIGYSLSNLEIADNPFVFYTKDDAEKLASAFTKYDTTFNAVLKESQPNIILIVLESFTANVVGCINEEVKITPHLDSLASKGILFTRIYASGTRTDRGMLAIYSGYPAQTTTAIIKFPNKTQSLPGLPRTLRNHGYHTYFYYGGDIDFANYRSYLLNIGFKNLFSLENFASSKKISKWGVPDEFLFEKITEDFDSFEEPYFLSLFTLSSHLPFDIPMEPYIEGSGDEIGFMNSVYYADHCLGNFIDNLESKEKMNNTLVIITADHGVYWYGDFDNYSCKDYHIPMIWYGDVLQVRDTVVSVISSQTDLASTLLSQLQIRSDDYSFSKNIFSAKPSQQILYSTDNGFGFVSDSLEFYYNHISEIPCILKGSIADSSLSQSKAYYQLLYEDFLSR